MPPYRQMPQPKSKGLVIEVPHCEWCKVRVAFRCRQCSRWTCRYCLVSTEGGKCLHSTHVPLRNDGWGTECPNPQCDIDCNNCAGIGIVTGPSYR